MTDTATRPPAGSGSGDALAEAGQRGRLEVAERAVERIATLAAGEVPGVQRTGSSYLESVIGHQYPSADAQVAGGHVKVSIDLAAVWPSPLAATAKSVRDRVRSQLEDLAGLTVDRVDVTVAKVTQHQSQPERRVT